MFETKLTEEIRELRILYAKVPNTIEFDDVCFLPFDGFVIAYNLKAKDIDRLCSYKDVVVGVTPHTILETYVQDFYVEGIHDISDAIRYEIIDGNTSVTVPKIDFSAFQERYANILDSILWICVEKTYVGEYHSSTNQLVHNKIGEI